VVVTLAALAPALALVFYLSIEQNRHFIEEFKRDSGNIAEAVYILQRQFADETRQLLFTLEHLLQSVPPGDIAAQERILRDFLAANPSYLTFALADREGLLVAGAKPVPPGIYVTSRRYWLEGARTMSFSAGEFAISHTAQEPAFHFALPRTDARGGFNGMLIATVRLTFPEKYLAGLHLPQDAAVLLTDTKGVRLHRHPRSHLFPEGEPIARGIMEIADSGGPSGFFKTTGSDGLPRFYSYRRLSLHGQSEPYAVLFLTIPAQAVESKAGGLLARNLFYLLAAAFAALGLARFLGRRALVEPAARLVSAARKLGAGDMRARADQDSQGGELGILAATFNEMAGNLLAREEQRQAAESARAESERKFRTIFEHTRELFGLLSAEGLLLKANPAALSAVGASMEDVAGKPFWETPWWNDDPKKQLQLRQALEEAREGLVRFETFHLGPDGGLIHVDFSLQPVKGDDGEVLLFIAEGRDITERHEMESLLRHMALHDPLTGLANRALLRDRIEQAIAWSHREPQWSYALLFIDLDRFKVINDSLGHGAGDAILKEVGRRLQSALREGDTLARYGGDEFVALARGIHMAREAVRLARRLTAALAEPLDVEGSTVSVSASIGIELNPPAGATPDELIRNANLAMHHAKQSRRGKPKVYTQRLLEDVKSIRLMEQELPSAMENGQLQLVFQPIVNVELCGPPAGFEVLCRWYHPEHGPISPMRFIRMAEETGFISRLGEWVLDTACRTLARWKRTAPAASNAFISVNVSPRQLDDAGFPGKVRDVLDWYGIDPRQLHLEITETAIMDSSAQNIERLNDLARLGVHLSIDDFGTGYSNLALMTRLPVSDLKIDLSIVMAMDHKPANQAVVRAIVTMARTLGLSVVAEGVETAHQRDMLRDIGCGMQQGFFHARPLSEDAALALLSAEGIPDAAA